MSWSGNSYGRQFSLLLGNLISMRDSFIIYRSFYESIKDLPETNQVEIWNTICEFALNQNELNLTGISSSIFKLIRPQLEANYTRFPNGKKAKQKQNVSKPEANVNVNHNDKYNKFIEWFNKETKRNFKGEKKSRAQFNARINEGYTFLEFKKAIDEIMKDQFHRENNYKYLTPEFITRIDKLEKWKNTEYAPPPRKSYEYNGLQGTIN